MSYSACLRHAPRARCLLRADPPCFTRQDCRKMCAILPDAKIAFAPDAAGFEQINRMDGTRLKRDLGYTPPSLEDRIRHQIDVARRKRQQPPLR